MGKNKKGYNWKSRQVIETSIDNSKTRKILVEGIQSEKYDDCNALVIPSEKRKTKKKHDNVVVQKVLSKKQRKRLEQIVDRRKKKETRSSLLDALSQVQASPDLLSKLVPITTYQTYGLKRVEHELSVMKPTQSVDTSINVLKGYSKRRKLLNSNTEQNRMSNPNIVGFELSSESSEEELDIEEVNKETEDDKHQISSIEENANKVSEENNKNRMEKSSEENDDGLIVGEEESKLKEVNDDNCKPISKTLVQCSPAVFVPLNRPPSVQEARLKLPVLGEEQIIMEAISENDVVVLAGETGSGKTTQLPQFLYEAGYARNKIIGITEPRRVAAVSMSKRVAYEMGLSSDVVSYLMRYEGNVTEKTQIKFMTDGVLLKEIQSDFTLSRYSVIVLDEAHERSVYTDILLGLLSRIVPLRRKQGNTLKLVIMSATLRLEDFVENKQLFRVPPPVISVESRQFPVTIHFNKRTCENYVREAYLKVCKIHTQLPDGGILIFLTGQQEVKSLVNKLRKTFPYRNNKNEELPLCKLSGGDKDCISDNELNQCKKKRPKPKKPEVMPLPIIDLDEFPVVTTGDENDLALDDDDDQDIEDIVGDPLATREPMWVLPLYSLLPGNKQAKVFDPPPPGARLCVVATNVAETSLTIPSVRYVVDSGKEKRRQFDKMTGVSAFVVTWTSKASADQRAGRAGRTGPGHCYRLYSSAVFNDQFERYSIPEMQRKPVDDLVLQMKSMGIYKVINFPFPSPPDVAQLQAAERKLCVLGALKVSEKKKVGQWEAQITPLGNSMAAFPVSPRFAKMLALSHQQGLLPYTICMVAALAVPEVLLDIPGNRAMMQIRQAWAGTGNSLLLGDPMVLMRAIGAAEHDGYCGNIEKFCEKHALRYKAVVEVRKLRLQLTAEINLSVPGIDITVDPKMPPPTEEQARLLRQLLLSGLGDQVAHRVDPDTFKDPQDRIKWKNAYRCGELDEPVRIHSTSVLKREAPLWVVYQEVFETDNKKLFMRGVTAIEPEWLPLLTPSLCNLTEPLMEPSPHYDIEKDQILCHVTGTYGRAAWTLPLVQIDFPTGLMRYKWFAQFFLNGSVCPLLASYSKELLSSPGSVIRSWAGLQLRTELLLKALISEEVDSRTKLFNKWEKDNKYLLKEYLKWLPESMHTKVSSIWPPLNFLSG